MKRDLPWLDERLTKKLTRSVDIRNLNGQDVPEKPGVYIMQAKDQEYPYPWRKSRVFYVGKSKNLRHRLCRDHRRFTLEIAENRPRYEFYWPRYEYGGYHGCMVCWLICKDDGAAGKLENDMLVGFASYCGARPVANHRGAWLLKASK